MYLCYVLEYCESDDLVPFPVETGFNDQQNDPKRDDEL